jgi:hypothetical protein
MNAPGEILVSQTEGSRANADARLVGETAWLSANTTPSPRRSNNILRTP